MKIKDLIKELSALDEEYDILADFYDKENDIEYEFDFKVEFDFEHYLNLEEIMRY